MLFEQRFGGGEKTSHTGRAEGQAFHMEEVACARLLSEELETRIWHFCVHMG